jgi:hypothetical protein
MPFAVPVPLRWRREVFSRRPALVVEAVVERGGVLSGAELLTVVRGRDADVGVEVVA